MKLERILFTNPILARNKYEFNIYIIEFYLIRKIEKVIVNLYLGYLYFIYSSSTNSIPKFLATNDINTILY